MRYDCSRISGLFVGICRYRAMMGIRAPILNWNIVLFAQGFQGEGSGRLKVGMIRDNILKQVHCPMPSPSPHGI